MSRAPAADIELPTRHDPMIGTSDGHRHCESTRGDGAYRRPGPPWHTLDVWPDGRAANLVSGPPIARVSLNAIGANRAWRAFERFRPRRQARVSVSPYASDGSSSIARICSIYPEFRCLPNPRGCSLGPPVARSSAPTETQATCCSVSPHDNPRFARRLIAILQTIVSRGIVDFEVSIIFL